MRHFLSCLIVASVLLLASAAARAADPSGWDVTFDAPALGSYLPPGELSVIVLAAGPASPALRAPTDALTRALRRSGRATTVLDDASVGALGAIDDAAALDRVSALPVTHVAIVRVVVGDPPRALVSIYAKAGGRPVAAFIATAGVALAPAGPGSTTATGSAATRLAFDPSERPPAIADADLVAAKKRYQREYIGSDGFDIEIHGSQAWAWARVHTRFYLGELKTPLEGADFYKAVGRDDLVEAYETRGNARTGLVLGGLALGLASIYPYAKMERCGFETADYEACDARNDERLGWGIALSGLGALALTIGIVMDSEPVDDVTRRGLADSHNADLKAQLHLEAGRAVRPHHRAWALAPAVGPGYQGMRFALAF